VEERERKRSSSECLEGEFMEIAARASYHMCMYICKGGAVLA
jgi:hypothetical protein